jgi:hypothetical protein
MTARRPDAPRLPPLVPAQAAPPSSYNFKTFFHIILENAVSFSVRFTLYKLLSGIGPFPHLLNN